MATSRAASWSVTAKKQIRAFDAAPGRVTEMDALVAYLQILGRLTDAAHRQAAAANE